MFKRVLVKNTRSPESVIMALIVPIVMMVLFGMVFGSVAEIEGFNYINFIVPGIILQCVCNMSGATAMAVHTDMSTGIIDRFRSMRIAKSAFLAGHVYVSVLRSIIITAVIIGFAFAIGFRPEAGLLGWLAVAGILVLFIIAMTWMVVINGLIAKSSEDISGFNFLLLIFTFISSAFAPVDTLPRALAIFARHQPITQVIDALRALLLGLPVGNTVWLALAWSAGIALVSFLLAVKIYKSKLTQ